MIRVEDGVYVAVKRWLQLSFLAVLLCSSPAQTTQIKIESGSSVSYEVEAKALGLIPNMIVGINRDVHGMIQLEPEVLVRLFFPVVSFRSGNTTRDESVASVLKSTEFPDIEFRLVAMSDTVMTQIINSDSGQFLCEGELTVAGQAKRFDFTVDFLKETPTRVTFNTHTAAKFTDFGLDPPALGYIIQIAPDRLLLRGELVITVEQ